MLPPSTAQLALTEVLRQRLAAAGCQYGRFDVSEPGACLSLSGQKTDGGTLFFWEFGQRFHQLVADYLRESYDDNTALLTIYVDVARAEFRYAHLTKQQQAAADAAEMQRASERRPGFNCPPPYRPGASLP